jgi:hypothetical protein
MRRYRHNSLTMGSGGLKLALTCFFTYAAVVQFNDPDAGRWIAVYGAAAMITSLSIIYHLPAAVCASLATLCIGWILLLLPRALALDMAFRYEEPREIFGLGVIVIWMAGLTVHHRKIRTRDSFFERPSDLPAGREQAQKSTRNRR